METVDPPPEQTFCMISWLLRKTFPKESLLRQLPAYECIRATWINTVQQYPSTHFTEPPKPKLRGSKSMPVSTEWIPNPCGQFGIDSG